MPLRKKEWQADKDLYSENAYDPDAPQQEMYPQDWREENAGPAIWAQEGYGAPAQEAMPGGEAGQENAGSAPWPQEDNGPYFAPNIGDGAWLGEDLPLEEERPPKRTIFKPRTRKPSFFLAVIVNSMRMLLLLVLLLSLSGVGAVMGVANAYMETAPTLDLAAIDDQA